MDQQLLLWLNHDASSPGLDIFFAWLSQTTWFSVPLFFIILALTMLIVKYLGGRVYYEEPR